MAATNEFTGTAADWQADGNWSLGRVPTEGDDVLIDGRSVTATNAVSVRSLTLAGAGLSYGTGGNYGRSSAGTEWQGRVYSKSYGPSFAPLFSGSPAGLYVGTSNARGPGTIVVLALGAARIDGVMDANGTKSTRKDLSRDDSGPSGGGIWLAAKTFAFGANAALTAEGGDSAANIYGPGGGGRIAVGWKLSEERLAALAETGTFVGLKAKRIGDRAAFCAAFNLPEEAVDVSSPRVGTQADHPGSFVFFDGHQPGLMLLVK